MGVKKFRVIMASIHWALHAQSHLTFQLCITDWKWGLPAVSQFRHLRRICELGQWEEGQACRGVPIGSGRGGLFLLQFAEAGDQPSSWRAPEAKKWRQLSKKSGGGGDPTVTQPIFHLFLITSSGGLLARAAVISWAGHHWEGRSTWCMASGLNERHSDSQTRPTGW